MCCSIVSYTLIPILNTRVDLELPLNIWYCCLPIIFLLQGAAYLSESEYSAYIKISSQKKNWNITLKYFYQFHFYFKHVFTNYVEFNEIQYKVKKLYVSNNFRLINCVLTNMTVYVQTYVVYFMMYVKVIASIIRSFRWFY